MKVITTEKVFLQNDREGQLIEHVQIDLRITNKDDVNKIYTKSYAEYDEQKEMLLSVYGEETELKGSELDDFLLQKGLLYNLVSDNIYDGKWEAR